MALAPTGLPASQQSQTVTTKAVDVVAILRADTKAQVLASMRPMRGRMYDTSELMDHPLEDGSQITDHAVKRLVEIDLPLMLTGTPEELKQSWAELQRLYDDRTILIVQSRVRVYTSMVLKDIPHDEDPEAMNGVAIGVRLREARFVSASYGGKITPKATPKKSTVKRGAVQTTAATGPQTAKAKPTFAQQIARRVGL